VEGLAAKEPQGLKRARLKGQTAAEPVVAPDPRRQ
jgi:hypothetical protein